MQCNFPVVLKLENSWDSPGGLVTTSTEGPAPSLVQDDWWCSLLSRRNGEPKVQGGRGSCPREIGRILKPCLLCPSLVLIQLF